MSKSIDHQPELETKPLYSVIWDRLKIFPKGLAVGSQNPPNVSGPAAAALISAGIGYFLMIISHHLSDTSEAREQLIWMLGSWIPGSHNASKLYGNIGPTTGKETVLLIGWLTSWAILHRLWRHKNIKPRTMFFWFSALFIISTAMSWHPLFPYLKLMPTH
jgi:hypothetical protein